MALKKVKFQPGFDKQGTPAASPGKWIDGDFVRFRYGIPEKIGGWQQLTNENYNKAEIIIAKQRHGPIGSIKMHFDANYTKFSDLTSKDYDNIIEWLTKVVF